MRRRPMREGSTAGGRIVHVVLFFEILLVLAAVLITWFAVYVLYRLVTDES
ncbi:Uncharacterised protein [Gordonia bronchialis]|nr:Uncharacterised protein [Gordonia bronchialis]